MTPGRELSQQNVGLCDQAVTGCAVLGDTQVEGDGLLVAVQLMHPGVLVDARFVAPAHAIQSCWIFNLDDLGAVIRKQSRGVRAGPVVGEIQHGDACQWLLVGRGIAAPAGGCCARHLGTGTGMARRSKLTPRAARRAERRAGHAASVMCVVGSRFGEKGPCLELRVTGGLFQ